MNGVADTRVGRDAVVGEIWGDAVLLESNVFQHGPKPDGLVNLRLSFRAEVNGLGVAPSFHVEHAVLRPAVLVVANQRPFGIAAEGGFACARQTKKDRHVPVLAHVGRTMHGQNIVLHRQDVIHHGEHALFDFARVA